MKPFAAGAQGASKVVCTTEWLLPMNVKRIVSPGWAVRVSGVKENITEGMPPGVAAGW